MGRPQRRERIGALLRGNTRGGGHHDVDCNDGGSCRVREGHDGFAFLSRHHVRTPPLLATLWAGEYKACSYPSLNWDLADLSFGNFPRVSPYRRNILVGVVVLGALMFLGWMIRKFGYQPATLFASPTAPTYSTAVSTDGVAEGSPVLDQGVNFGRITGGKRSENGREITLDAQGDVAPPPPANVAG